MQSETIKDLDNVQPWLCSAVRGNWVCNFLSAISIYVQGLKWKTWNLCKGCREFRVTHLLGYHNKHIHSHALAVSPSPSRARNTRTDTRITRSQSQTRFHLTVRASHSRVKVIADEAFTAAALHVWLRAALLNHLQVKLWERNHIRWNGKPDNRTALLYSLLQRGSALQINTEQNTYIYIYIHRVMCRKTDTWTTEPDISTEISTVINGLTGMLVFWQTGRCNSTNSGSYM